MKRYNPRILAIKDPATRAWMKYIWRDVNENRFGYFGVITGLPGSGKTYTNMLFMWLQDESFTVDNLTERVTRNPREFLKNLNELDKHQWISMTDAGLSTSISSKNWNKLGNILMEDATQIQRVKQNGVSLDVQIVKFIDNRVRALLQWFTVVKRYEKNPAKWNIHRVQVSQIKDHIYYPHPIMKIGERMFKLKSITLEGMIPKEYRTKFEEVQLEFKENLLQQHADTMNRIYEEENPLTTWERIEKVKQEKQKYLNQKGQVDADLVMLHMDVGRSEAAKVVKFIKSEKKPK